MGWDVINLMGTTSLTRALKIETFLGPEMATCEASAIWAQKSHLVQAPYKKTGTLLILCTWVSLFCILYSVLCILYILCSVWYRYSAFVVYVVSLTCMSFQFEVHASGRFLVLVSTLPNLKPVLFQIQNFKGYVDSDPDWYEDKTLQVRTSKKGTIYFPMYRTSVIINIQGVVPSWERLYKSYTSSM